MPDLNLPGIDLGKLTDADRSTLLHHFVDAGKILAKCTDTQWDDLFFKLLDSGVGPVVIGADAKTAMRAAVASDTAAGLSPDQIAILIQLAMQVLQMFIKK